MCECHHCAVDRTNLLLGEPLGYAGVAECMLAVWCLKRWCAQGLHARNHKVITKLNTSEVWIKCEVVGTNTNLHWFFKHAATYGAQQVFIHLPLEPRNVIPHGTSPGPTTFTQTWQDTRFQPTSQTYSRRRRRRTYLTRKSHVMVPFSSGCVDDAWCQSEIICLTREAQTQPVKSGRGLFQ